MESRCAEQQRNETLEKQGGEGAGSMAESRAVTPACLCVRGGRVPSSEAGRRVGWLSRAVSGQVEAVRKSL